MSGASAFASRVGAALSAHAPAYGSEAARDDELDLSLGETHCALTQDIVEAAMLRQNHLSYQLPAGLASLRQAYLALADADHLSLENVLVTSGAKQALWLAFAALVAPGDLVLLPRPGWAPYRVWLDLNAGQPIFYDAADPAAEELLHLLRTGGAQCVVINTPNNPTGVEYSPATIALLCEEAARSGTNILADEVYRAFSRESASFAPHIGGPATVAIADSVSKNVAAAGLRVGFLLGGGELVARALAMRGLTDSCPPAITQIAAEALLSSRAASLRLEVLRLARERLASLNDLLSASGYTIASSGAIYSWVRAEASPLKLKSGLNLRGIAGTQFGTPGLVRLCPTSARVDWNRTQQRMAEARS